MMGRFVRSCDLAEFTRLIRKYPNLTHDTLRKCSSGQRILERERRILSRIESIQVMLREIDKQGEYFDEKLAEKFREKEGIIRQHMDRVILDSRDSIHEKDAALNDGKIPARLCHATVFEVCDYTFIP